MKKVVPFQKPRYSKDDFPSSPTPKSVLLVCPKCGASEWYVKVDFQIYHSRCDARMRQATEKELASCEV